MNKTCSKRKEQALQPMDYATRISTPRRLLRAFLASRGVWRATTSDEHASLIMLKRASAATQTFCTPAASHSQNKAIERNDGLPFTSRKDGHRHRPTLPSSGGLPTQPSGGLPMTSKVASGGTGSVLIPSAGGASTGAAPSMLMASPGIESSRPSSSQIEKYSVLLEAYHEGAYAHMRSTTRAVHQ